MNNNNGNINLREYVDEKFKLMEKNFSDRFMLNDRAVDQYSKTNDEWKLMHNDLQRKMERERLDSELRRTEADSKYVTKQEFENRSRLMFQRMLTIVSIIVACIMIYNFIVKK